MGGIDADFTAEEVLLYEDLRNELPEITADISTDRTTLSAEIELQEMEISTDIEADQPEINGDLPGELVFHVNGGEAEQYSGGYYVPAAQQTAENTMVISFRASEEGMPTVDPVHITLPKGPQGPIGETGPMGHQGPPGEVGPAGPQGVTGETGDVGPQGPVGETGPMGPQGPAGPQGEPGEDGKDGTPGADGITPHVGENGNWFIGETDTGIPATGPAGNQGLPGKDGVDGESGADGFSPTATVTKTDSGAVITFVDKNGTTTVAIENGKDGQNGENGRTPVKGTDYFTAADKGEIVSQVIAGLPTGTVQNAVTLSTAQTITGVKTFTASNLFDGEQKLTFGQYCPTVTDIASGIGASMKNARAVDCQLYVAEVYAPYWASSATHGGKEPTSGLTAKVGVIDFYVITGAASGQPTGRKLIMQMKEDGLYVLGKKVKTE